MLLLRHCCIVLHMVVNMVCDVVIRYILSVLFDCRDGEHYWDMINALLLCICIVFCYGAILLVCVLS